MAILTKREVWAKPRPQNETRRSSDLTPEEMAATRRALRFLRTRMGAKKLAAALRVRRPLVDKMCTSRGQPTGGLAIRAARVAGASIEDVLAGRWPAATACAHCGRA
jgi:plasmid maintenance system antidote protein VapI